VGLRAVEMLFIFLILSLTRAISAAVAEAPTITPFPRWVPAASGDANGPFFIGYSISYGSADVACKRSLSYTYSLLHYSLQRLMEVLI
jgi:hypothetical protein